MKINKKNVGIALILLVAVTSIGILILYSRNSIKTFELNNYKVSYDANVYNIVSISDTQDHTYFNNIKYKVGIISLKTNDSGYSINYQFKDKELPPSNAFNDINPIPKNSPNLQLYNVKNIGFGFDFILCQMITEKVTCFPVTENYNSAYNYGDELKNGNYYFESKLNLMGMNNTNLRIQIESSQYPELNTLLTVLQIQKDIQNAK